MSSLCPTCGALLDAARQNCPTCGMEVTQSDAGKHFDVSQLAANLIESEHGTQRLIPSGGRLPQPPIAAGPSKIGIAVPPPDVCVKCHTRSEGKIYRFSARLTQGVTSEIVHTEGVLICHTCAEHTLDISPKTLWARIPVVGLLGSVGVFAFIALGRIVLPVVVFSLTVGWLARDIKMLRYCHRKLYLCDGRAERILARMAIELRKKDVLKGLHLPASDVVFEPC